MNEQANNNNTTVEQSHGEPDPLGILANIYSNLVLVGSVSNLRRLGFEVEVDHERYDMEAAQQILDVAYERQLPAFDVSKLQSIHDLRKAFDEQVSKGQAFPGSNFVSSHGGRTTVVLRLPGGDEFSAKSDCCCLDPFNRRKGVLYCLRKIFKEMAEHFYPGTPYKKVKHDVKEFVEECRVGLASSVSSAIHAEAYVSSGVKGDEDTEVVVSE